MNLFTRIFALHFDRSFSGKGWKQLLWLCGVILAVFLIIYAISFWFIFPEPSYADYIIDDSNAPLGRLMQLICLFIDPGNINNVNPSLRWFSLLIVVIGLILFCGMLISVLSNMLERRVERFRDGDIVYPMSNHVVIIGFDTMVPMLIQQICAEPKYTGCHILIQSAQPALEIRNKIHTELSYENEKRIVILHARRDSTEDLEKLYTPKAFEVFLIGETNEHDHDSLNIDCLRKIINIHKKCAGCKLTPFTVLFEYQTTFAAFQTTDLSAEWRKIIEFHPFNFYEDWATKLLVNQEYTNPGCNTIKYPPLDREPITFKSEKHIHLVIIGMSRMGVALGVEAAHLLHFPNFCRDNKHKTVITFIDPQADDEMNFFQGRYRHFFEISPAYYCDASHPEATEPQPLLSDSDAESANFLDIRFEFIKGRAESTFVQKKMSDWANDEHQILTIAVCLNFPPQSIAMGLYLPAVVYEKNISVFVRQETSSALLDMLSENKKEEALHKYSHVFPFGMLDSCHDLDGRGIQMGQAINYVYDFVYNYQSLPHSLPDKQELKDQWNRLSVAHQWSNLYNAYSSVYKLRSVGVTDSHNISLSNDQIATLAQVEHNRWNVEKLLLGFRKPTTTELEIIRSSKDKETEYKKKRFVHPDICPYAQLSNKSKNYDCSITACLPLVIREIINH